MSDTLDRDLDFADLDMQRWLANAPAQAEIAIDRQLIEAGGLRMFMKLAWHTVESVPLALLSA